MRSRATDTDEVINRRLNKALEELEYHAEYEFCIVNDELERAYALLRAIYLSRSFRRRPHLASAAGEEPDRVAALLAANSPRDCAEHAQHSHR